jgi:hypothetical protein
MDVQKSNIRSGHVTASARFSTRFVAVEQGGVIIGGVRRVVAAGTLG